MPDTFEVQIAKAISDRRIKTIHDYILLFCNLEEIPNTNESPIISIDGHAHSLKANKSYRFPDPDIGRQLIAEFIYCIKWLERNSLVTLNPEIINDIKDTGLLKICGQYNKFDFGIVGLISDFINSKIIPLRTLQLWIEEQEIPIQQPNPIGFKIR